MQPTFDFSRPRFDGPDLRPQDESRLSGQLAKVKALLMDGQWRTLNEIARAVGASEAGSSARLRDLRKKRFGGYTVERRRVIEHSSQFEYRLRPEAN